ncbi:MAG: glycoside hydrolase family 15 protein [Hyphomonadaceae bacterium]|nr:glycoside hydrolase family 15 protein [Hyphomonadaceae bacterium]
MKVLGLPMVAIAALTLSACLSPEINTTPQVAPGAPGDLPTWSNAEKAGIGTAYEAYDASGQFSEQSPTAPISKVWFSLGRDRITEVMSGLIHEAQLREIKFELVGDDGAIAPLNIDILPVTRGNSGGSIEAPLHVIKQDYGPEFGVLKIVTFTDPDHQTLVAQVSLLSEREDLRVFAYIDPALGNSGIGDRAWVDQGVLNAETEGAALSVTLKHAGDVMQSVGFVGHSDSLDAVLNGSVHATTGDDAGNVAAWTELPIPTGDVSTAIYVGFGATAEAALAEARASKARGEDVILEDYRAGWIDYLAGLEHLPALAKAAEDGGALAYMSALNLKIMEDKTHAGALIASLSNPWGETAPAIEPQTGYKAVWPRDFFQVASAFVAMGDEETARASYRYLPTVQVTEDTPGNSGVTGWFLQKTHVDGALEWVAIQQDQTAMPIMLGWQLWKTGVISDEEMALSYQNMLKPAADFLVEGGRPNLLWNTEFEASLGYTQQERWEEQEGYSPSTIAAVISGLVTAADLAERFGDAADAASYLAAADELEANLEAWTFTTEGSLGDGEYFLRISRDKDPNNKAPLGDNNGRPGLPEDEILDGGFLELVRYGVRAWNAPSILETLEEFDAEHEDNLRVRYTFGEGEVPWETLTGWRRYGNDGYGEDGEGGTNYHEIDGGNTPGQRGRVWPFFSGERGHALIAQLQDLEHTRGDRHPELVVTKTMLRTLIKSMEAFANPGLSLPEQVWDGVGPNPFGYEIGEGTNSATPLAWTHAEYIKLLRSVSDGKVWDRYEIVEDRYRASPRNALPD